MIVICPCCDMQWSCGDVSRINYDEYPFEAVCDDCENEPCEYGEESMIELDETPEDDRVDTARGEKPGAFVRLPGETGEEFHLRVNATLAEELEDILDRTDHGEEAIHAWSNDEKNGIYSPLPGESEEEFQRRTNASLEADLKIGRQQVKEGKTKTLAEFRRLIESGDSSEDIPF